LVEISVVIFVAAFAEVEDAVEVVDIVNCAPECEWRLFKVIRILLLRRM